MAALTKAAVSIGEIYYDDGTSGRRFKVVPATLTLTGQGGLTNNIPAALFGLSFIRRVHAARMSDSTLVEAAPSYDGTLLVLAANDGTGAPADRTGTLKVDVVGVE